MSTSPSRAARVAFVALAAAGGIGCETPAPAQQALSVAVAPLAIAAMTDACYGITVYDTTDRARFGPETEVWSQPHLCASRFGQDGGVRFTGVCDAESSQNAIRLVLVDLYAGGTAQDGTPLVDGVDYLNPCPAPAAPSDDNGCILAAPCDASQDTRVLFNLTVLRNASLGFFDTVVKFQDLFCSAKLDCVESDGVTPLAYLPDPATHADGATAVLGFACTGGASTTETYLYLDDLVVTCTGPNATRSATVDPSAGPGMVTPNEADPDAPILFGAAVHRGDGGQLGTAYWNVLLGLNLGSRTGESCTLTTRGTASEAPLTAGTTPLATRYPVIGWDVPLSIDGARACQRHPLNVAGSGVATAYTRIDAPAAFAYQLARGAQGVTRTGAGE